jgi:aconitase A
VSAGASPFAADLRNGSVVIAAITSCTNTSKPAVLSCSPPRRPAS